MNIHGVARWVAFRGRQWARGVEISEQPHFDAESMAAFVELLGRCRVYLEFGAGGSTILAARLGIRTISVESDRHFARALRRRLGPGPVRLVTPNIGLTGRWGFPAFRKPTPARLRRWRRYVEAPFVMLDRTGEPFPDLVLVDGRFRRACALMTALRARERGQHVTLCFDDYADRPSYWTVAQILGEPRMAGRMAIFSIDPMARLPIEPQLEGAMSDYR